MHASNIDESRAKIFGSPHKMSSKLAPSPDLGVDEKDCFDEIKAQDILLNSNDTDAKVRAFRAWSAHISASHLPVEDGAPVQNDESAPVPMVLPNISKISRILEKVLSESSSENKLVTECLVFFKTLLKNPAIIASGVDAELVEQHWARLPSFTVKSDFQISRRAVSIMAHSHHIPLNILPDIVCQLISVAVPYCDAGTSKYNREYTRDVLHLLRFLDDSIFNRADAISAIIDFLYNQLLYNIDTIRSAHLVLYDLLRSEDLSVEAIPIVYSSGIVPLLMKSRTEMNGRNAASAANTLCRIVRHSDSDQIRSLMTQGILEMICKHTSWRQKKGRGYGAVTAIFRVYDYNLNLVLDQSPGLSPAHNDGLERHVRLYYKYVALWLSDHSDSERNILSALPVDVAKIVVMHI